MRYVAVQGTDGWEVDDLDVRHPRNWWRKGSLLFDELALHGLEPFDASDPFIWSTDLDGVKFWERWPWFRSRKDKRDWLACGKALRWYLAEKRLPGEPLVVISHSHGAQGVHYAAAEGLQIDTWLDVAGPVRKDVLRETADGLKNIRRWLHVTDEAHDLTQALGRIGDGHLGDVRLPDQVKVLKLTGIDHSALLSNPTFVPSAWREHGLIEFLLEAEASAV